jgi:hypothetical protein
MPEHLTDTAAKRPARVRARNNTPPKLKVTLLILLTLALGVPSFAGTLPLNTGYDYSSWNTYPAGINDDYWIRIASYPAVTPPVGPSWAVLHSGGGAAWSPPLVGPTLIPSMWINAFGSTNASPSGSSVQNPAYAIFRKCFCMPQGYSNAAIRGSVRNDDAIQIWLNSVLNTVLPPSSLNINGTPYQINYANQSAFRTGRNCLYALVEDTGGHTGFNLAANLTANNVTPLIAKGPGMSFEPCACGHVPTNMQRSADSDEQETLAMIVKLAEQRRLDSTRPRSR